MRTNFTSQLISEHGYSPAEANSTGAKLPISTRAEAQGFIFSMLSHYKGTLEYDEEYFRNEFKVFNFLKQLVKINRIFCLFKCKSG